MANPILNSILKTEYQTLFDTCEINPGRLSDVDKIVDKIIANRPRYESVGNPLKIPWYFIGILHNMECSLRFDQHLHNGDPLSARTVHVPANRPPNGNPPFTWEDSATDALVFEKIDQRTDWSLPALLYFMEGFNGFGYRKFHPLVKSPYLWSFSNHYTKGKYAADGKWDADLVSQQCGTAVILSRMKEKGAVDFDSSDTVDATGVAQNDNLKTILPSKGLVVVDKLNIRADAGTKFDPVALPLTKGANVEIQEEKDGWYKVKATVEGWVVKNYINTQV